MAGWCVFNRAFSPSRARFVPRACNPAAGWEKGKVERAGVGYVRQNFWPLRSFADLDDVNRQARQWLTEVANQRQHREHGNALSIVSSRKPCGPCRIGIPTPGEPAYILAFYQLKQVLIGEATGVPLRSLPYKHIGHDVFCAKAIFYWCSSDLRYHRYGRKSNFATEPS